MTDKDSPFHAYFVGTIPADADVFGWNGITVADAISTTEEEMITAREAVTVLDVSPLNKYRITGPDAGAALDTMMSRKVSDMKGGTVRYVGWVADTGMSIGDATLFCFGENNFMIIGGLDQSKHFNESVLQGRDAVYARETEEFVGLGIQGPQSYALLVAAGAKNVENLRAFQHADDALGGVPVIISRTNYVGDLGYEIFCEPGQADALWEALNSTPVKLLASGYDAIDLMRVECGFIDPSADCAMALTGGDPDFERTPADMGLGWMVELDREDDFIGKAALKEEAEKGSKWQFVSVELEDMSDTGIYSLSGVPLFAEDGTEIGLISTGGYDYFLKKNVGIGTVHNGQGAVGTAVQVGDDKQPATIVATPMFSTDRRTKTPPALS